ncbi:2,3-dihydroxyphenylpropionate/2,3-dihydroxicinnamic acid 1,2-dioxygenase like protein [Zymoseptoria brevis]|uniref:2,3-dihydroxyphenylpropionate/2, 3-dihydroxicinnamic acid 1,2-dioxygenase like protein n=1 Tax=Zymoseptoria brevis TaxID=1047168 RepID=A0A0F4GJ49_9PEZI|nr:2,3-dihydroxyphenylpropionate/2,3-dihydroxicinnamic acid 1,2-dioxygenase like protein [Zymoseptoria brevis]
MSGFLQCLSHTPLIGKLTPAPSVIDKVDAYTAEARGRIEQFDPQLVSIFGPDHFNGFFNDDVDVAVSQRMRVDHGFTQPLDLLLGRIDKFPVIAVFVNCVAKPLPTSKRTRILGETIGNFCKALDKRVLFLASGGLSHQPPIPEYATASEDVRQRLLGNPKVLSPEAREARTIRTIEAAKTFVDDQTTLHPLAPEWDQSFIKTISAGKMSELDGLANKTVTEAAGASTHEVKMWVAANATMAQFGPYEPVAQYYRPIPEWIAGYGGLTAQSRPKAA